MDKRFNYQEEEQGIYKAWEEAGYFSPEGCIKAGITNENAEPFSMVLPPPNVTAELHMGHAMMLVIEDIIIRYRRMRGYRTLWIPGTDHAAIATQSKVEDVIYKKENKTRHDLGREEFLKRVEKYAKENHDTIINQIRAMGASLDWGREAFTLDEKRRIAVQTAFKNMYDDGLIYRGKRLVNWDPKLQTTISDDEIEWVEEKIPFYYFQYGPFIIGTTRPETKFGDKYVVMHPDDKRYKDYKHGQKLEAEWINGKIETTVIKDKAIDPEFGSGVMTITPWHDATDFEIAERHNLDKEQIIDFDGKLLSVAGEFAKMPIEEAREKVVEKLDKKGLLVKVDKNYIHRVAVNHRGGGGKIEPQIKLQWFIDVNKKFKMGPSRIEGVKENNEVTLKELMRKVVKNNQIEIIPEHFKKIYFHWIENLRDWCISRQIWYGHRIPVWYRGDEIYVGAETPNGDNWKQDPDTLDTWFSSGLWTFSTLGWPSSVKTTDGKPGKTSDLAIYHPTTVLETGYDILFFWVARMILMTTYNLGEIPFKTVFLHGMVKDDKGRKMSKSLGNGIDPLDMIKKYGTDATRLSLIIGVGPGSDINLSEDKVKAYRNFGTKIWNVARFLDMSKPNDYSRERAEKKLTNEDKEKIKEMGDFKKEITKHYEKFEFHIAGEKAYDYLWNVFANKILEDTKVRFQGDNKLDAEAAFRMLEIIFLGCIKILHPFMPFVTEAVYQKLKLGNKMLIIEEW